MTKIWYNRVKKVFQKVKEIAVSILLLAIFGFVIYKVLTIDYSRVNDTIHDFIKSHFITIWIITASIGYITEIKIIRSGHLYIGPVSFLIVPHVVILYIYIDLHNHWAVSLLLCGLITITLMIIRKLEMKISKRHRSDNAVRILDEIKSSKNSPSPFCLYIRSFFTTNALMAQYEKREVYGNVSEISMMGIKPSEPLDVEFVLSEAVSFIGPLIALGEPEELLGAGRIKTTEEEWKEDIILMMEYAELIVVIPTERKGILWEIEQIIKHGYLDKTVWIMPQKQKYKSIVTLTSNVKYIDIENEWNIARKAFMNMNISLPPFNSSGEIFRVDQMGKSYAGYSLSFSHTFNIAQKIKKVLIDYGIEVKQKTKL